jgi:hypothetical protein
MLVLPIPLCLRIPITDDPLLRPARAVLTRHIRTHLILSLLLVHRHPPTTPPWVESDHLQGSRRVREANAIAIERPSEEDTLEERSLNPAGARRAMNVIRPDLEGTIGVVCVTGGVIGSHLQLPSHWAETDNQIELQSDRPGRESLRGREQGRGRIAPHSMRPPSREQVHRAILIAWGCLQVVQGRWPGVSRAHYQSQAVPLRIKRLHLTLLSLRKPRRRLIVPPRSSLLLRQQPRASLLDVTMREA